MPWNIKPAGIPAISVSTYPFDAASVVATGVRGIVTCPPKTLWATPLIVRFPVPTVLPVIVTVVAPASCAIRESPNNPPGPSVHIVNVSVVPVPLPVPVT